MVLTSDRNIVPVEIVFGKDQFHYNLPNETLKWIHLLFKVNHLRSWPLIVDNVDRGNLHRYYNLYH